MLKTPLHPLHLKLGAKMCPFAGYDMPVSYPHGTIAEHEHTREAVSLFDVSHMGVITINDAKAIESLVPADIKGLKNGEMCYTFFTNDEGGIIDDLIVIHLNNIYYLIVNAGRKNVDILHIQKKIGGQAAIEFLQDRVLLALQGPKAFEVMGEEISCLSFLEAGHFTYQGIPCIVSRSGYTGEDGFEIIVDAKDGILLAELLLRHELVEPAGLGARDTLRLEAGLCLYGADIDATTTPVEANLMWSIPKIRREAADFPGAKIILDQLEKGPARKRVGIRLNAKIPARHDTEITNMQGKVIGKVTSGSYGPTVEASIAMGYVDSKYAEVGNPIAVLIRGKQWDGQVIKVPFEPHHYVKKNEKIMKRKCI